MVRKSPVEDSRLEEYRELTLTDPELRNLSELWCNGWPETRREVPEGVRVYWPFRDEIHVENGLVMRGDRLVISVQKRREVLAQLHAAHCGVSKMKLRARSALYWPAMSADIETYVGRCHHCAEHRPANPKQPMLVSEIPELPWQIVYTDLLQHAGRTFLIVVDAYSFFWEIKPLRSQTAKSALEALFEVFQSFGYPVCVKSDNGPCYKHIDFTSALKQHGIKHSTSSPYHPKGNSLAERAVREAKKLLRSCEYGTVPYSDALLVWRNTPRSEALRSPAERLMGRQCRTQIPATSQQLRPVTIPPEEVRQALHEERAKQKAYYDKGARDLPPLRAGAQSQHLIPDWSCGRREPYSRRQSSQGLTRFKTPSREPSPEGIAGC